MATVYRDADLMPLLPVALVSPQGGVLIPSAAALADATANPTTTLVGAVSMLFNGTTEDRQRGNTEGTLLASAVRTTQTTSPVQTNYNARGVHLFLNVTANPGGAETLFVGIRAHDLTLGVTGTYMVTFIIPAATNGVFELQMYPGDTATSFAGGATLGTFKAGALPRSWVATVQPSAAGNWTFSLDYSLIV